MKTQKECVVLMDNGSLRPEAVFSLRRIAADLSLRLGVTVHPVSLLHSSKISAEKLGGEEANTWRRFLRQGIEKGITKYRIIPLFFGPSSAIVDYLPKVSREVIEKFGAATVEITGTLIDVENPNEDAVARLLTDFIIQKLNTGSGSGEREFGVVVVDHGSPLPEVAVCRDRVASQVAALLGQRVHGVIAASMERRDGEEYAFNEPLLENALEKVREKGWSKIILSYLFFSPGRHAGPGGDIDEIVASSDFAKDGGVVFPMPLVGESPRLVSLLEERYLESVNL